MRLFSESTTGTDNSPTRTLIPATFQVLNALGVGADKLRGHLGESMASVQKFDKPLQEVTTSSA
jgi:hypothetical protein